MSGKKPVLPIHQMSFDSFNRRFKGKHLDKEVLTKEDIDTILSVFGLSDRSVNSKVGRLCCDEYHGHSYGCNYYMSPEAGVVDRLTNEIYRYQSKLEKMKKQLD